MKTKLYGKLAHRCKLIRPFPVLILHFTDGIHIAQDERGINYGAGSTKGEALTDFKRMCAADYLWLKQQEAVLHPSLRLELEYLQQFIRRY